jgi:acyl-homoserine lactone synthase
VWEPMIFVVDAGNRKHFATDLAAMHRQRKAVFVDRAGWKLPVVADQEIDRYDLLRDTVYLLAKNEPYGDVLASVRILTTVGPHLMQELCSGAHRTGLPSGPTVWEVSRYCTAPGITARKTRLDLLWEIICGILETALKHGGNHLIFAANRALLPHALTCGWDARTVGTTVTHSGDEATIVVAAVTADGLHRVSDRYRIHRPVVRPSS